MTNIVWLTIRVHDLDESLRFYEDLLGLRVDRRFSPAEGTEIIFLTGDTATQIELIRVEGAPIPESSNVSIGIAVPDPEKVFREADASGIAVSEPMRLGPDLECRFVQDPNGVSVQIVYEVS